MSKTLSSLKAGYSQLWTITIHGLDLSNAEIRSKLCPENRHLNLPDINLVVEILDQQAHLGQFTILMDLTTAVEDKVYLWDWAYSLDGVNWTPTEETYRILVDRRVS